HILFPKINATLPSSLAPEISVELTRERLKFDGVLITDDIDMKSIADHFPLSGLAQQLLAARVDLVVINHHPERAEALVGQMAAQIFGKKALPEWLIKRADQLTNFLTRLSQNAPSCIPDETLSAHGKLCEQISESYAVDRMDPDDA
ncbi:MAG: hypothetical protein HKM24_08040, partial [Gammaproteobacteria bacterium]|nr:hypothetical protein [Gammaproteobacteria bacterium]